MSEKILPISHWYIIRLFLKTGSQAFGGWSTTALLLEKELVTKQKMLTKQHLDGAVAYAQFLPGATQVGIVSNVGYRLKGVQGSVLAVICYLLPDLTLILLFAIVYFHYLRDAEIGQYMTGLTAALGGIILANAYRIGKGHVSHPLLWIGVITAFVLRVWFGVNTAFIIFAFGIFGGVISFSKGHKHPV